MTCGIYQIVCKSTGKKYIGSSKRLETRFTKGHRYELRKNSHGNTKLQNAWNKYGEDDFFYGVIEYCTEEEQFALEQQYIDAVFAADIQLNVSERAGGGDLGAEVNAKRSAAMKGKTFSDETRRKMSEACKGKTYSAETKQKLSEANKGKTLSEEQKQKLSESLKGNTRHKGKQHNVETCARIAAALKGNKNGEGGKGRTASDETRRKMSEALKARHAKARSLNALP